MVHKSSASCLYVNMEQTTFMNWNCNTIFTHIPSVTEFLRQIVVTLGQRMDKVSLLVTHRETDHRRWQLFVVNSPTMSSRGSATTTSRARLNCSWSWTEPTTANIIGTLRRTSQTQTRRAGRPGRPGSSARREIREKFWSSKLNHRPRGTLKIDEEKTSRHALRRQVKKSQWFWLLNQRRRL